MVLPDRIELSTSPLPMECSTTELRQHVPGLRESAEKASTRRADPCHKAGGRASAGTSLLSPPRRQESGPGAVSDESLPRTRSGSLPRTRSGVDTGSLEKTRQIKRLEHGFRFDLTDPVPVPAPASGGSDCGRASRKLAEIYAAVVSTGKVAVAPGLAIARCVSETQYVPTVAIPALEGSLRQGLGVKFRPSAFLPVIRTGTR
jgi:hypothetical protein